MQLHFTVSRATFVFLMLLSCMQRDVFERAFNVLQGRGFLFSAGCCRKAPESILCDLLIIRIPSGVVWTLEAAWETSGSVLAALC